MGPILSAVASIGKEFLAEKAAGLLNGKDKNEIDNTQNEAQNEVLSEISDEAQVDTSNEYHSANDDNSDMNIAENEGGLETSNITEVIPDTVTQVEDVTEKAIPETNNTESEFSADNIVIPGEQEISEVETNKLSTLDSSLDTLSTLDSSLDTLSTLPTTSNTYLPIADAFDATTNTSSLPTSTQSSISTITPTSSTSTYSLPSYSELNYAKYPGMCHNDTLVEAIENKDPVAVENAIESDPIEAESILKDDTALDNEAVQAIDGGNDVEVNNEAVKEALEQNPEDLIESRPNFHDNDPAIERMQARIDRLNNEPDEDFLGPDEYIDENGNIQVDPNWKPENADEDFLGPDEYIDENGNIQTAEPVAEDKQLAVLNDGMPEETYSEPVYDTSDYNFDWDYDIQTLGVSSPEEIPDAPVENKEQARAKQRLMHWFKSKHLDQSSKSGPVDSTSPDTHNERLSIAGRKAGALSIPASGNGSVSSASMGNSKEKQSSSVTNNSIASKTPLPVALEDNQGREVSVNGKATTMPVSGKNGSMRSGSFGLMSKPSRSTKVGKPVGAMSGGVYHTQSNGSMRSKSVTDGKEVIIERIKTLLSKLPPEATSKMGFKGDTYRGKSLNQYDGFTLQNISKQLEKLIGE